MNIDINEITQFLYRVGLLKNLRANVIEKIAQTCKAEEFTNDDLLIKNGKVGQRMYIIYKGRVEVRLPDVHGEVRKRVTLKPGDVVGEISLLIQSTYSADIVALSDTIALCIDRSRFVQLIDENPEFAEVMSELMTSRMAQNGGINRVGKYQLMGVLGEGSMATVFRAYDSELDREVALKMLKYKLARNSRFLDRFEQEAKIIAGLNHPHIVNVYEVINDFSTRFIVMEKLHGENLAEILKSNGAFGIRETRNILAQVASALQYAHSQGESGIVHRDIKPSNIVIDHNGNIKLTDFGISGPPRNKDLDVEGTPSYVAPEVISGSPIDGRADIYSLGVMAFQMLTNSLPFSAATMPELLALHVAQNPPDIRFICLDIDEELAVFVENMLEKKPGDRISDWERIGKVLTPVAVKDSLQLGHDELGVLVKLRGTSYQDSERYINAMLKILKDEDVDFSIETHRGDTDN